MTGMEMWAAAVVALFVKSVTLAMLQGYWRTSNNAFAKPEDAKAFGKGAEVLTEDLPAVQRAQGAIRNDGENIPYFLFVSFAHVHLECWPVGVPWLLGAFVLARCAHSLFMVSPRQPYRTISFGIGLLVTLTMAGQIVWTLAT